MKPMSMNSATSVPDPSPNQSRPWGFWATLGFSLIIGGANLGVGILVVSIGLGVMMVTDRGAVTMATIEALGSNGVVIASAALLEPIVCVPLLVLFVKIRKGPSVTEYLALNPVSPLSTAKWFAALALYLLCIDRLNRLIGHPDVQDLILQAYRTVGFTPLLWAGVVIGAPLFEETFFRGFIFRGLQQTRLGNSGTIVATAALWTTAHLGFEVLDLAFIFGGGILLGIARLRSGSIYLTMLMHAAWNIAAMTQVALAASV